MMEIGLFSLIALRFLGLPLTSTAQSHSTVQCPNLPPSQHVSRIYCEKLDGSVVEVDGLSPFHCKLSYIAIRPGTIMGNMHHQQQETPQKEHGQCELWVLQFSDGGLVQQSCCGEAGERLFHRVSGAKQHQNPDWDPVQQPGEYHHKINEPVQHFQMHEGASSEDEVEGYEHVEHFDEYEHDYYEHEEVQYDHGHEGVQHGHGHEEVQHGHGNEGVQHGHGNEEVQYGHGHEEVPYDHGHEEVQYGHGNEGVQHGHGNEEVQYHHEEVQYHHEEVQYHHGEGEADDWLHPEP